MNSPIYGLKVSFALISFVALGLVISQPATAASLYSITDLGLGSANDINDVGQVVGTSSGSVFIWSESTGIKDLGTFGGSSSVANSINNLGQVVGRVGTPNGSVAFFWSENNVVNDLGTLLPPDAGFREEDAIAINDSSTVLVRSYVGGFFWSESTGIFDTNIPGFVNDLNNLGQVVGSINGRGEDSFIWSENRGIIEFRPDGVDYSSAQAINDLGQVAGISAFADKDDVRAYFWTETAGITDLGTLGESYTDSFARDINNLGQIVGSSRMGFGRPSRAFIWENGVMSDLNDLLVDGSGWVLSEAQAINEKGQVVGSGLLNGETHAFVLNPISSEPEPVPEPSSILGVLAFGAVGASSLLQRSKTTTRSKF